MMARRLRAKHVGTCRQCNGSIRIGDAILWTPRRGARHVDCETAQGFTLGFCGSLNPDELRGSVLLSAGIERQRDAPVGGPQHVAEVPDLLERSMELIDAGGPAQGRCQTTPIIRLIIH